MTAVDTLNVTEAWLFLELHCEARHEYIPSGNPMPTQCTRIARWRYIDCEIRINVCDAFRQDVVVDRLAGGVCAACLRPVSDCCRLVAI